MIAVRIKSGRMNCRGRKISVDLVAFGCILRLMVNEKTTFEISFIGQAFISGWEAGRDGKPLAAALSKYQERLPKRKRRWFKKPSAQTKSRPARAGS